MTNRWGGSSVHERIQKVGNVFFIHDPSSLHLLPFPSLPLSRHNATGNDQSVGWLICPRTNPKSGKRFFIHDPSSLHLLPFPSLPSSRHNATGNDQSGGSSVHERIQKVGNVFSYMIHPRCICCLSQVFLHQDITPIKGAVVILDTSLHKK
jgi:hypothetical protein